MLPFKHSASSSYDCMLFLQASNLCCIFFALASTFIVMFLAVAFGNIGRFLGIIFLVIQLGSCGGSFPIQVTRAMGGFFQMVNPFLPMTYSVYGFRESLTSGLGANQVWISVGVQLIYIIASIVLLWVAMNAERSKVAPLFFRYIIVFQSRPSSPRLQRNSYKRHEL